MSMVLGILPQSGFHTSLHPFASRPRRWPPFTQRLHTVASTVKSLAHRIDVIDAYTLLRIPSTVREEDASMVVDNLWSLQYMVPGPLTAGAFITHETDQRWGSQEPRHRTQHRAHALHFRFNKDAAFHAFFNHPLTIKAFESAAHDQAIELGTLCCRVSVANELETLFRRGAEWEKGLELVVALEESSVQVGEPLDECLFLMERLATSSAFGAVHAASGDIQNTDSLPFMSKSKPTKVFIARFGTESQLTAFLNSPPVEALLRPGGGLPAPWMSVLESAPAENTKNLEGLRRMF